MDATEMLYIHRLVVPDSCRWSKTILRQLTISIAVLMASLVAFGFTPVYSQTKDSSMNTTKTNFDLNDAIQGVIHV